MTLIIQKPIGHKRWRLGRSAVGAAIVIAALIFAKSAVAETVERPFSPPVGSRWTIENIETETDEGSNDPTTTSTKKTTQLLTYEGKLPEGYRISFQTTASTFEGDTDNPVTMRAGAAVMRGLTYREPKHPAPRLTKGVRAAARPSAYDGGRYRISRSH
jgi:hypothetical protein